MKTRPFRVTISPFSPGDAWHTGPYSLRALPLPGRHNDHMRRNTHLVVGKVLAYRCLSLGCQRIRLAWRERPQFLSEGGGSFSTQYPKLRRRNWGGNIKLEHAFLNVCGSGLCKNPGQTAGLSESESAWRIRVSRC